MRGRERTVNVLTKRQRQQELNKETATGQAGLNKMPELLNCTEASWNHKRRGNV
jgi:hypothetical protein